jgi:Icc-related predicted phosphoesterase
MTGKALVPIIDDGGGRWHATLLENRQVLEGDEQVAEFEQAVKRRGYYPFRVDPDELRELAQDEPRWHALFERHMLATVKEWMDLADERLDGTEIRCLVCPGNDDQLEVDSVVAEARRVELGEGRVVEIDGYQMVSSGWSNRTPWDTYREEDEPQLAERIKQMVDQVTTPPELTIFSLHCPPYGTGLDDAPELTEEMDLKDAGHAVKPVGSTAVRDAIEAFQPALGLHGHIHEARGTKRLGRTLCINPGSSYEQGQLLGAIIDIEGGKQVKKFMLTSG